VSCQLHAPAALPLGKVRYSVHRELCGQQDLSGRHGKVITVDSNGTKTVNPLSPNPYPVAISTGLSGVYNSVWYTFQESKI
jgi:hypothetical protein